MQDRGWGMGRERRTNRAQKTPLLGSQSSAPQHELPESTTCMNNPSPESMRRQSDARSHGSGRRKGAGESILRKQEVLHTIPPGPHYPRPALCAQRYHWLTSVASLVPKDPTGTEQLRSGWIHPHWQGERQIPTPCASESACPTHVFTPGRRLLVFPRDGWLY